MNPQFQGSNSSVVLLQKPIHDACIDQRFVHLPAAFDDDDDSLSFELIIPLEAQGLPVPDYVLPNSISPGSSNQIFFNPENGEFIWDAPQRAGEYNIAIRVTEWRNGVAIGTLIRDMQITVRECDNRPPDVKTSDKVCVVSGETILRDITVDDPDQNQKVRLEGSGAPFMLSPSEATLTVTPGYQSIPLTGQFEWNTTCNHISKIDYSVVFKGEDNFFKSFDTTGLVDLHEMRIHVSGPAPQNLDAFSSGQSIVLEWDSPYACEITEKEYFRGFTVWRKLIPTEVNIDTCGTDLSVYNYTPVKFQVKNLINDKYQYLDDNVEKGVTYCYRITAEFAQISAGGNPYNRVQSLPSNEICIQVSRDLPLITHVTVDHTSSTVGEITIRWVPPLAADLDTMENPGPYRYVLLRSTGIGTDNFIPVAGGIFNANTFSELVAINSFVDTNLDTENGGFTYAIDFFATDLNDAYGQSQSASSIYLNIVGTDRRNLLSWRYEVPWFVRHHIIYRENPLTSTFDSIALLSDLNYDDHPVINDTEYCYYIKSVGSYGLEDIIDPLENLSQIDCAVPVDSVPPCTPQLNVINACDESIGEPVEDFVDFLTWHYDSGSCVDTADIATTEVYFISNLSGDTTLVQSLEGPEIRTYQHTLTPEETGCYFIRAIDINGNVGNFSTIDCTESCPEYELPNVFTPNQDGANDLFKPFPYRFVTRIDIQIFTRWGTLVFESQDPDINWDGRDLNGNEVEEDIYFYVCHVYSGGPVTGFQQEKSLRGNITLVRD